MGKDYYKSVGISSGLHVPRARSASAVWRPSFDGITGEQHLQVSLSVTSNFTQDASRRNKDLDAPSMAWQNGSGGCPLPGGNAASASQARTGTTKPLEIQG